MKITSRNVNGIRAVLNKGFCEWVKNDNPDVLCLQEIKAFENQIPAEMKDVLKDYEHVRHAGKRAWYAWTATYYKKNVNIVSTKNIFPEFPRFHEEWRVVEIVLKDNNKEIVLLNCYFPNGWTRADWTEMLTYKLDFFEDVLKYINSCWDEWKEIIVIWDINICHKPIDIINPKAHENLLCFLPEERAKLDKLQENRYTDVFRYLNPNLADKYTWWSYGHWARARNIGRRIDYFRVSKWILDSIQNVWHQEDVLWSDHCPISLEIK